MSLDQSKDIFVISVWLLTVCSTPPCVYPLVLRAWPSAAGALPSMRGKDRDASGPQSPVVYDVDVE